MPRALEDILGHPGLTLEAMATGAVAALLFFLFGWLVKAAAARRLESDYKLSVLEAKSPIPQLESSIRKRDSTIARLQEEIAQLNDSCAEQMSSAQTKDQELRAATREAHSLRSQLEAVKGTHSGSDNVILDGFDAEVAERTEESALQAQLEQTQALCDQLKESLTERDARIQALEIEKAAALKELSDSPADAAANEAKRLTDERDAAMSEVARLTSEVGNLGEQLAGEQDERAMLLRETEDLRASLEQREKWLAKLKRSMSERDARNKALQAREADAAQGAEARLAELEASLSRYKRLVEVREISLPLPDGQADTDSGPNLTKIIPIRRAQRTPKRASAHARRGQPRRSRRSNVTTVSFRPPRARRKRPTP